MRVELTSETTLAATCLRIQDWLDCLQRTWREFIVISFISRRCSGEHNEIAILAARCALIWIVLEMRDRKESFAMNSSIIEDNESASFRRAHKFKLD